MRLLYLTNSLPEDKYDAFLKSGRSIVNPSNQNFHFRLISILSSFAEISVIHMLPDGVPLPESDAAHLYIHRNQAKANAKPISIFSNPIELVIYDAMSISLSGLALSIAKKNKIPSLAVITDNYKNITGVSRLYEFMGHHYIKKADAYLTVNPGILETLKLKKKPSFSTLGFVDEPKHSERPHEHPYIYFAGALLPRYGAPSLIEAFPSFGLDYDLLIAGHHEISEIKGTRVIYLGQVSKEENLAYQEHASLLINPRPYDPMLAKESFPSKMLEYLSSGAPILSTPVPALEKDFSGDINWIEGKDLKKELLEFFRAHKDENGKLIGLKPNNGKEKLLDLYGLRSQAERLQIFLAEMISRSSKSITDSES